MSVIRSNILEAKRIMQRVAARIGDGEKISVEDREQLKLLSAWCDSIREDESLHPADVYMKAFGKDAA